MGSDSPSVWPQSQSSSDAAVVIPLQRRVHRIAVLSDALVASDQPRMLVRIAFPGNPPPQAIAGCDLMVDRLPGGWIRVAVWPELWVLKTSSRGDSPADRRRQDAMRAAGWGERTRVWELDPADAEVVGEIVDAIQVVLDLSLVPPAVEWSVSPPKTPEPVLNEPPLDEPWVEEATERDLRERLVRLAGMRGGRILVRVSGASATIAVAASLRRGTIVVSATNLGVAGTIDTEWKAHWTLAPGDSSAARIFSELGGALRLLSPPGSGDRLAVRLEQRDVAQAYAESYAFFAGWLLSLPVAFVLGVAWAEFGGPAGLMSVVGDFGDHALDRSRNIEEVAAAVADYALVTAVAITMMMAAGFAAWTVDRAAQRLGWRYTTVEILQVCAALAGSVAYFGLVFAAGEAWGLVLAAPWVLWIGTAVIRRLLRAR